MSEIDIVKVKGVVDNLVQGKVIDKILTAMEQGFGEVEFKITIHNKQITFINSTSTEVVKILNDKV